MHVANSNVNEYYRNVGCSIEILGMGLGTSLGLGFECNVLCLIHVAISTIMEIHDYRPGSMWESHTVADVRERERERERE